MINFSKLHECLLNNQIKFMNCAFNSVMKDYLFYQFSKDMSFRLNEHQKMTQKLKDSEFIIIDQNEGFISERLFIIGFEKTLIIVDESSLSFIQNICSNNPNLSVCFLSNTETYFKNMKNYKLENDRIFQADVERFMEDIFLYTKDEMMRKVWSCIAPCISSYLIKKSYIKLKKNRIQNFIQNFETFSNTETIEKADLIELRNIGNGILSSCTLFYHIKLEELLVVKKPNGFDAEIPNLLNREKENYSKIKHPLMPRFYGTVKDGGYIVIEYINGQILERFQMSGDDIFTIIFEIMLILKYFHENELIYRDLKPNNVIIDENKTVVLIDFDRLSKYERDGHYTADLSSDFIAPEIIKTNAYSVASDVYSLGKMIEYMIDKTESLKTNRFNEYTKLKRISAKCLNESPKKRPPIRELIKIFITLFQNNVKIGDLIVKYDNHYHNFGIIHELMKSYYKHNIPREQFFFGIIYYKGIYVEKSIDRSIYYLSLSANNNNKYAQYKLGLIYLKGKYVNRDISKANSYFKLAANQKHIKALIMLGVSYIIGIGVACDKKKAIDYLTQARIENQQKHQTKLQYIDNKVKNILYSVLINKDKNDPVILYAHGIMYTKGILFPKDYNKAIRYFKLAANQNHDKAQLVLGEIYLKDQFVPRNVDKAIHYLTLAANQNNLKAQLYLGLIYFDNNYTAQDINKAINYFILAANQNSAYAQYALGSVYTSSDESIRNINKAIHYLSLASNQNLPEAQFSLGLIYYKGEHVSRDINKAIHFYSLAANQNFSHAQFNLGMIYISNQYVEVDIDKALHFLTLASKQNHPLAHAFLGSIYYLGEHVPRDINKAIHYFSLASEQNVSEAQFQLGTIYYHGEYISKNIDKAIEYFTLAANQNHMQAQFYLGRIFIFNIYGKLDIRKAIHYFTLSANQNFYESQFYLGMLYIEGSYVPQDVNKAIHYFTLSANQGYSLAQYNLGSIYYEAQFVSRDVNKAIHYFLLSANQNFSMAQFTLGAIYYNGHYIARDVNKAILYLSLAEKNKHKKAGYVLGIIYTERSDIKKAIHHFLLASELNCPEAQFNLGVIYSSGEYIQPDIDKALHFFKLASEQHLARAQCFLGSIYLAGRYVKEDINKAIHYLQLASNQNNSYSQCILGFIYVCGAWLNVDIKKSKFYFSLSSKNGCRFANFAHGYFLHIENDIENAIRLYKEASSFQIQYAKNNLGIIYKYKGNASNSIVYFREAIEENNDYLAAYNMANIILYDKTINNDTNEAIDLLSKSYDKFDHSFVLLCLAIVKKVGFNLENIKNEIVKRGLPLEIYKRICDLDLFDQFVFNNLYDSYREIDFLYNILIKPVLSSDLDKIYSKKEFVKYPNAKNISIEFYNGLGHDIFESSNP